MRASQDKSLPGKGGKLPNPSPKAKVTTKVAEDKSSKSLAKTDSQKEITIATLEQLYASEVLILAILTSVSNNRPSAQSELTKAFAYARSYCEKQDALPGVRSSVTSFLNRFSDTLNVTDESILEILKQNNVVLQCPKIEPVQALESAPQQQIGPKMATRLAHFLPDYNYAKAASSWTIHPVFKNQYLSFYPGEMKDATKVDMYKRLSGLYTLPENMSTYPRPILDIELHLKDGPCVRCYLALPGKPRKDHNDKDITQDAQGNIQFHYVNLMNFGDPLRAYTWIEDYLKNKEEHGHISQLSPIIRTFLITIEEYRRILTSDMVVMVDADRAPGQVKVVQGQYFEFNAVQGSLVSFTDDPITKQEASKTKTDGVVHSLATLGQYLFEDSNHPTDLTDQPFHIAHQHGRPIEGGSKKYVIPMPKALVECRLLERELSGYALEPTTKLKPNTSFVVSTDKFAFFGSKKNVARKQQQNQLEEVKLVDKARARSEDTSSTVVEGDTPQLGVD